MKVLRALSRSNVEGIDNRWQGRRLHQAEAAATSGVNGRPRYGGGIAAWRRAQNGLLDRCALGTAPTDMFWTGVLPATKHGAGRGRWYIALVDQDGQAAWKAENVSGAECPTDLSQETDLSQQDVCLLLDRVAELERELANANRYLEACREVIGAREGELLIDAIRRRSQELAQSSSR
ncbi:MAG TPA: hypothetical protein VFO14_09135 [Vicinamibacterales bacterium]|nr:hypothetical protein [Vicinamibacterales bacterium]